MLVINLQDQLQAGTFEHALHYLVTEKLDLSIFDKTFKNDHEGRPAYDPAILLKIILFAYSKGITSSREIQWCCETNIIFKALSCDSVPHFTTIASFISGYPDQIETLFEQILLICDEEGLLGHELFAIDGGKLPSDAEKTWSGTHKELTHKRDKAGSKPTLPASEFKFDPIEQTSECPAGKQLTKESKITDKSRNSKAFLKKSSLTVESVI